MSIIRRPRPTAQSGSGAAEPPPDETTIKLAKLGEEWGRIEAERAQLHGHNRSPAWQGLVWGEDTVPLPVVDRPLSDSRQ